ncbi:pentatricopeptide repeat-containing protein [Tanacetum coccineum]
MLKDKWTSDISSDIQKILEQTKDQQRFWHVIPSSGNKFEVRRGSDAFKVDEKAKISSCRMWQINLVHMLLLVVDDYVPECFRKDMYIKASSGWAGVEMTCHNCGEKGHNKKGCKNEPIPQTPKVPSKAGRPRKKVPIDTTNLVVEDDIPRFVNTEIDEYDKATLSNNVVFNNARRIELGMNWNKNKCGKSVGNVIGTQQSQVVGVDGEGTSNGARRTNVPRVRGAKTVRERRKTRFGIKNTSETSACNRRGAELYEILIVYISWYKSYDDACFFDDVKRIGADNSMIADMPVWKGKSYAVYTCVWNNFIDSGKTILGVDIRIAIFLCCFPIAGVPFKLWLHPGFLQYVSWKWRLTC